MRIWKTVTLDPEPAIRWFGKRHESDNHAAKHGLPVFPVEFKNGTDLAVFLNQYEETIRNEGK